MELQIEAVFAGFHKYRLVYVPHKSGDPKFKFHDFDYVPVAERRHFKSFHTIREAMIDASGNNDDNLSFGYYNGFRCFIINGYQNDNLDFLKFI